MVDAKHTAGPRRKVVSAIVGYQSFVCELSCGHVLNTGRWVTSWGSPRPAPKTMACRRCAALATSTDTTGEQS